MSSIAAELGKLAPSARIDLFEVDLAPLGGALYRFHNGANALSQAVTWQGHAYTLLPIEAEGFEAKGSGPSARPVVRLGNRDGLIGALARQYNHLLGATFTRRRTRAKFLDAVNFAGGVNPSADSTAELAPDVWRFDRVARRDKISIEWELVSPLDFEGVQLPGRQIGNTVCSWRYRGPECGFAGGAVARADDTATTVLGEDRCSLRVSGCKLRFGANAELPIGIFPGAGVVRNV